MIEKNLVRYTCDHCKKVTQVRGDMRPDWFRVEIRYPRLAYNVIDLCSLECFKDYVNTTVTTKTEAGA